MMMDVVKDEKEKPGKPLLVRLFVGQESLRTTRKSGAGPGRVRGTSVRDVFSAWNEVIPGHVRRFSPTWGGPAAHGRVTASRRALDAFCVRGLRETTRTLCMNLCKLSS